MRDISPIYFTKALADSRNYPKPYFPALPTIRDSHSELIRPTPKNVAYTLLVNRARYALAFIARAELSPGDTVLLPAYHCPALVEPFLWAGCKVTFYCMTKALTPELGKLEEQLQQAQAVVFVRYFGFDTNVQKVIKLAHQNQCIAIEDLAHAAFIDKLYGDYGVTSLTKFYPTDDGAEIYIKKGRNQQVIKRTIEKLVNGPTKWKLRSIYRKVEKKIQTSSNKPSTKDEPFRYFDTLEMAKPTHRTANSKTSENASIDVIRKRRNNYLNINNMAMTSSLGAPLFAELDPKITPYVFPFLLNNSSLFDTIRSTGIPLFRWEEVASTPCAVSSDYRSRLIQIPCHQDLTEGHLLKIEMALSNNAETIVDTISTSNL